MYKNLNRNKYINFLKNFKAYLLKNTLNNFKIANYEF